MGSLRTVMSGAMSILVFAGCSAPVGTTSEPILSGALDTTDTSVVALVVTAANYAPGVEICSGTVISPHVVLTAAHCIDPDLTGAITSVQIFLGNDFADMQQFTDPANFVNVSAHAFDPSFTASNVGGGGDIAYVVASTALAPPPIALNVGSLDNGSTGTAVHAVGFGESNGLDTNSVGPRRSIDTTIFGVDSMHVELDDVLCEGDSGGPTLLTRNGAPVIVGVHSFTLSQDCVGPGDDTRVDLYVSSFLEPAIAQYDPGYHVVTSGGGGCNVSGDHSPPLGVGLLCALAAIARRAVARSGARRLGPDQCAASGSARFARG